MTRYAVCSPCIHRPGAFNNTKPSPPFFTSRSGLGCNKIKQLCFSAHNLRELTRGKVSSQRKGESEKAPGTDVDSEG